MSQWEEERSRGERFAFGQNWRSFLETLDEGRIREAEKSLQDMLGLDSLAGRSFLDIGCGSGLFSLAARRLGARVRSFDFDPQSVECARVLKTRFFPQDGAWTIDQGSVLDEPFLRGFGEHDVVYSWGVLHHTGDMWRALEAVIPAVRPGGLLFISIYNYLPRQTKRWQRIKRLYNQGPLHKAVLTAGFVGYHAISNLIYGLRKYRSPLHKFREYRRKRGMSLYHDWIDWLGGYPYEAATAEEIFRFYQSRGFTLQALRTTSGLGTNQYVFRRQDQA